MACWSALFFYNIIVNPILLIIIPFKFKISFINVYGKLSYTFLFRILLVADVRTVS